MYLGASGGKPSPRPLMAVGKRRKLSLPKTNSYETQSKQPMPRKVQRTKPIAVRLKDEEKLDWDLKTYAAGLSISELVRQAMNRVRISHVGNRGLQIERTRQIAKIGNNQYFEELRRVIN